MALVFRAIGQNTHEMVFRFEGALDLDLINKFLINYGIEEANVRFFKFLIDGNKIVKEIDIFPIDGTTVKLINIFVPHTELRDKLYSIFIQHGRVRQDIKKPDQDEENQGMQQINQEPEKKPDEEITQPLPVVEEKESEPELSESIIDKINKESIKIFSDEDFKHLMITYMERPELFKIFYNYISHGNVIDLKLDFPESSTKFDHLIPYIKGLGFKISDEQIRIVLNKFNGHLNLSVRLILLNMLED